MLVFCFLSYRLIARLGLPVLAMLLFQFSAVGFYIYSNVEGIEEEDAANWSFLLRGLPFIIISLVTSSAFPVVASLSTVVFGWGDDYLLNTFYLVMLIIVIAVALGAGLAMPRIRSRVRKPVQAAPLTENSRHADVLAD